MSYMLHYQNKRGFLLRITVDAVSASEAIERANRYRPWEWGELVEIEPLTPKGE